MAAARGFELEEELNVKSFAVEDLSKINAVLQEEITCLWEDLEILEKRIVNLKERNVQLNTMRDKMVDKKLFAQEELNYCKSDNFRNQVIDDFKSVGEFVKKVGNEAATFLDKGCVHIIRQLHHHFQDKSILLQALEANFDDEIYRGETDFVPYTR